MAQARAPKARLLQDAVSPGTTVKTYFRKPVMGPGPPGIALFGAVGGMIVFGLWKVVEHNRQANRDRAELREAKINLIPMLQAEEDRRFLRERKRQFEEEAEIMKDVPGWVPGESVYKTRWMHPEQAPGKI